MKIGVAAFDFWADLLLAIELLTLPRAPVHVECALGWAILGVLLTSVAAGLVLTVCAVRKQEDLDDMSSCLAVWGVICILACTDPPLLTVLPWRREAAERGRQQTV